MVEFWVMNTGLLDINQTVLESYLSILNGTTLLNTKADELRNEVISLTDVDTITSAKPVQKSISIIPIKGPIQRENLLNRNNEVAFWGMDSISMIIDSCREDENNHAIVMDFKSGGGFSNDPASVIASMIKYLSTGRKIYASGDMACSAAYHIAVFCSAIYANSKSAIFGCMGTKWEGTNTTSLDKKVGYINVSVTADATPDKNAEFDQALNGKPGLLKDHLINPIAQHFIDDVKTQRPGIDPKMLRGATVTAQLALDAGMIDGIMSLSDIIEGITTDKMPTKQRTSTNSVPTNNVKSNLKTPKNTMEKFNFSAWMVSKLTGTSTPEMDAQAVQSSSQFESIKSEFDAYKTSSEAKIQLLEAEKLTNVVKIATLETVKTDLTSELTILKANTPGAARSEARQEGQQAQGADQSDKPLTAEEALANAGEAKIKSMLSQFGR